MKTAEFVAVTIVAERYQIHALTLFSRLVITSLMHICIQACKLFVVRQTKYSPIFTWETHYHLFVDRYVQLISQHWHFYDADLAFSYIVFRSLRSSLWSSAFARHPSTKINFKRHLLDHCANCRKTLKEWSFDSPFGKLYKTWNVLCRDVVAMATA